MNKELIKKLKQFKELNDDHRNHDITDEDVTSSKEFEKAVKNLSIPVMPMKKLEEPVQPTSLYFEKPHRYLKNKNEIELMTYKECFETPLEKILEKLEVKYKSSRRYELKAEIIVLIALIVITSLCVFLFGFPYIFNWSLATKISLNVVGGLIVGAVHIFWSCYVYRDYDGDYELICKLFPVIATIRELIINDAKEDIRKLWEPEISERRKYLEYEFPNWYGYPYRVKDIGDEEYILLYKDDHHLTLPGGDEGFVFPMCDGVDSNERIIFPDERVKEHMTNPSRRPSKEPHYAPSALWDYVNAVRKYYEDVTKYNENKKLWNEYDDDYSKYDQQMKRAFDEAKRKLVKTREDEYRKSIAKLDLDYPEGHYWDINEIIDILETGKADDLSSAFIYLDKMRLEKERIEAMGPKNYQVIVEYRGEYDTFREEYITDCRYVNVEANSEAEAITAAKNMVEGAIYARILS